MNVLFIGDISARPGRESVKDVLSNIKQHYEVDFVIANCENAAGGRGVTRAILKELESYGVDFFTAGDHVWAQKQFHEDLYDLNLPIIRPLNYEGNAQIPGKGYKLIDLGDKRIFILSFLGQGFMREPVRSPFWVFDEWWNARVDEGILSDDKSSNPLIFIDFHAETTAEKLTFGWYVHSRVSAFFGTHTHVATADARLMGDMAYVTDVGMCGPYNASLWVNPSITTNNFMFPMKEPYKAELEGPRIFNSVLVTFEGKEAKSIKRIDKILQ